jgi:hypothetical protein
MYSDTSLTFFSLLVPPVQCTLMHYCRNIGIKTIVNMLKGKTTQEMRERFKIVNDLSVSSPSTTRKRVCKLTERVRQHA